jgi:hypothetical protein
VEYFCLFREDSGNITNFRHNGRFPVYCWGDWLHLKCILFHSERPHPVRYNPDLGALLGEAEDIVVMETLWQLTNDPRLCRDPLKVLH